MNALFLVSLSLIGVAPEDQWPGFRGTGDSRSPAQTLPLRWSETEGVAWTADLPGTGQSSPVVANQRVVVTSIEGPKKERVIVSCLDLATGDLKWKQSFAADQPATVSNYVSRAAPTPAMDADRIYAFFETGNLVALDHDGKTVWSRSITSDYGPFRGNHGLGSSLALTRDSVIVLVCHDGPSYTLALDKATGATRWKTDRAKKVSWSSPIVSQGILSPDDASPDDASPDEGGERVFISSSGTCEALDAATGKQLWIVNGLEGNTVPSASVSKDLVIVGSKDKGATLAIRRGGTGDVTDTHIAWRSQDATATFSSPLVYQGHVYSVSRAGVAYCLDAKDGGTIWKNRIGDSCWTSPLGAAGRIYFFGKGGKTTVVAAGPEWKVLAENNLSVKDRVYGIAVVGERLLLRDGNRLTCLR